MFQMNPSQSWITVLIVALFVATFVWMIRQIRKRAEWDRNERAAAARRAQLAIAPAPEHQLPERRLTLVPDLPRMPEPDLYDWRKQGI